MSSGQSLRGLQPHRRAVAAVRELALERAAQVVDLLLVDEQVAVARDAELVAADHLDAGEQLAARRPARWPTAARSVRCAPSPRQRHDARQRARRLHDGELAVAAEGVLALQAHDEVQALVLDARERARRVEPERAQHRLDLALEVLLQPLRRPRASSPSRPSRSDALARERRQQHLVQAAVLLGDQAQRRARGSPRAARANDMPSAANWPEPSSSSCLRPATRISKNSSRLLRGDAQEAQPLQQRHRLVEGLREHALVELEERQLAVDVVLGDLRSGASMPTVYRLESLRGAGSGRPDTA